MIKAIARRNEIQRLLRKLETLEKQVNADKSQKKRKPRQRALTTLVMELLAQVERLQEEMEWIKKQFSQQLSTVQLC
ncbi:MAG: hypothetical protein QNJ33_13600 [Crocosphaera sp.]|nr:hypothetical protein [Crocosphaera sp.]